MSKSRSKDTLGAGLEKNASSTEVKGAFGWKVGMGCEDASETKDEMGALGRHQDTRGIEARAAQTGVCKSPGSLLGCKF